MVKRKRKESMTKIVADMIKEAKVFSLLEDNKFGFKTIAEVITNYYLLRNCSERDRLLLFNGLLPRIKSALPRAIEHLENIEGIPIRKWSPSGKRNLEVVTILSSYRKAKKRDSQRTLRQIVGIIRKKEKHLKLSDPAMLPQAKRALLTDSKGN